jgi:molybdate transport system substrate-binding protein
VQARVLIAALVVFSTLLAGSAAARPVASHAPRLTVYAAASLTEVFPKIERRARYNFAGSDQLALQIQQGGAADVFAAASPKYPEQLYKQGLVKKPITFATNTLILIVPKSNPAHVHSVTDLTRPGVKVVIGDASVPVGSYTRTVLTDLGILAAVMKNVVSQETDVKGVLTKVVLGEADAGFVYVTDARPVKGKVGKIAIRASAQPKVVYEAAVVKSSSHLAAAYAFLTRLVRKPGQRELVAFGFGRKPKPSR